MKPDFNIGDKVYCIPEKKVKTIIDISSLFLLSKKVSASKSLNNVKLIYRLEGQTFSDMGYSIDELLPINEYRKSKINSFFNFDK